jgi:hypothetical protein
MNAAESFQGLACPRCGGMVAIPEGYAIVICPFCDLRSIIQGDKGIRRLQVPNQISKETALESYEKFLVSSIKIAHQTHERARVSDAFLVHLPFWNVNGRGLGWGFGKKKVSSGKSTHYVPKEIRVAQELHWNRAACDVHEFGVNQVKIEGRQTVPFDPQVLHHSGMVFEPVGSSAETLKSANQAFEQELNAKIRLSKQTQLFVRIVNPRLSLVYYPLWVVRYIVLGRAFQVVVDGYSGEVLYGKAPGSVAYRAASLVLGMATGSVLAIDAPAFILRYSDEINLLFLLFLFGIGLAVMYFAWRIFRYAEHYEFQRYKAGLFKAGDLELGLPKEALELINNARKMGLLK